MLTNIKRLIKNEEATTAAAKDDTTRKSVSPTCDPGLILRGSLALVTMSFLCVGCSSNATTNLGPNLDAAVDSAPGLDSGLGTSSDLPLSNSYDSALGLDGPRANTDGALGTTTDLVQGASYDGAPATDGVLGMADSPGQVDVSGNSDAGLLGSPDLVVSGDSNDASVSLDMSSDTLSVSDGPAGNDTPSGGNPDASPVDTSLGTGDVAAPIDVGSDGTTGPGNKIGVIAISETSESIPGFGAIIASGAVATFGFRAGKSSCDVTTQGDCQLFVCTAASNPTPTLLQAGTVTITGLAMDVPLNLMQGTAGASYTSANYSSYLWTSSRQATVVVTGSADVPAFTMNLTAPNSITVTSPLPGSDMAYTISRSSDLVVTWSGGVDGSAQVNISSNSSGATTSSVITCNVDAAKGTVTVPASLMSGFTSPGGFGAGVTNSATKTVGDWLMEFQAEQQTGSGSATFTN